MVYDAKTASVVLFGGFAPSGILGDTWTWAPPTPPGPLPPPPISFLYVTTPVSSAYSVATVIVHPTGTVGQPFFEVLHSTGGYGYGIWNAKSGQLPRGSRSSPRALLGTPTTAGTYTFTAEVMDLSGRTATHQVTVSIQPAQ